MAVRYKMKVMNPSWLDAVVQGFQSGRRADYDDVS